MTSTSTPKSVKHVSESDSPVASPLAGPGPGGHKPSFKSTKLARRARSFKDDFLVKISQMRSPVGPGGIRSHSPKDRKCDDVVDSPYHHHYHHQNHSSLSSSTPSKGPEQELENLWKETQATLTYFRDVVSKQKLEMLPGNGTIVLDTVWQINLAVKSSVSSEYSSSIISATHHMYQSVARLIKLCDDALIDDKSSELTKENVNEIVTQVEQAVQKLIKLAQEKLAQQKQLLQQQTQQKQKEQQHHKTTPRSSYVNTSLELSTQRNSLPDIPLTPRERQQLESNSCGTVNMVRNSHSSESILRDSSPPPKPPLPDRVAFSVSHSEPNSCVTPPPLPPKKKQYRFNRLADESFSIENSPIASSLERVSMRSKSPEDSSSILSASAGSLDSVLNSSRDDEEIKALMDPSYDIEENHTSDICGANGINSWDDSPFILRTNISSNQTMDHLHNYHRLSNTTDSGVSMGSYRSSSYSKRSSQQSSISSQFGATSSSLSAAAATTATTTQISSKQQSSSLITECLQQQQQNYQKSDGLITLKSVNHQKTSTSSSSSSLISTVVSCGGPQQVAINLNEFDDNGIQIINDDNDEDNNEPPAIPQKTRKSKQERQPSPYDNVPENNLGEVLIPCQMHQSQQSFSSVSTTISQDSSKPPPLPPKKKHIMAYMEMFGNCSHGNEQEFMRHSMHIGQTTAAQWTTDMKTSTLPTTQSCSFSHTSHTSSRSSHHTQIHISTNLPSTTHSSNMDQRFSSPLHSPTSDTYNSVPPALPPKQRPRSNPMKSSPPPSPTTNAVTTTVQQLPSSLPATATNDNIITTQSSSQSQPATNKALPDLLEHTNNNNNNNNNNNSSSSSKPIISDDKSETNSSEVNSCDMDLMEENKVDQYLIMKKADEDGPDIRGGPIDALIIQATRASRIGGFMYQEAFLTTYRTFISPQELISKLIRRYKHFHCQPTKRSRANEAFALIVRVVSDLTVSDLDNGLQYQLMNFVQSLISSGEIILAKALRVKHLERHQAKTLCMKQNMDFVATLSLTARNVTLLDFKSEQIAEQMTLLDAELFMKIEIPEVLIWVQEQNEERSPNLTKFTEHFNKMSYWARTRILTTEQKDVREKYFLKFIKIMKHLRKINNFNSYLALLSALDSAPIRRLEWQKHVQEGLKEYCALIDSSSSFRAYRQALAETQPPCIPYIGIVLQDLTFVHIGNSNLLPDGAINFSKRWQQYNIVENMKKFKKDTHNFKRNERIIQFFQNFDDIIGEDAMWQLSESIKPRKKTI